MADKKITDLQLRSNVNDDVNFPGDDGIQTYRVTAPQVATYALAKPRAIVYKTANYTATALNHVISCDATGGSFTILLPTAVGIEGKIYRIKRTDSAVASVLTIDGASAETIEGFATLLLEIGESVSIMSDNVNWFVIERSTKPFNMFNGYMDGTCSWDTTSSSFVDGTNTGGNTLTTRVGNMAVTAAAGNAPGITFTPANAQAIYLVTCISQISNNTTGAGVCIRLYDGTNELQRLAFDQGGASGAFSMSATMTALFLPGTASPVTLTCQLSAQAGHAYLLAQDGVGNGLEWTVLRVR